MSFFSKISKWRKKIGIQGHLFLSLLILLPIIFITIYGVSAYRLYHSINELSDSLMLQLARRLANVPVNEWGFKAIKPIHKILDDEQLGEADARSMTFAIWNDNDELVLSDRKSFFRFYKPETVGFSNMNLKKVFENKNFYVKTDDANAKSAAIKKHGKGDGRSMPDLLDDDFWFTPNSPLFFVRNDGRGVFITPYHQVDVGKVMKIDNGVMRMTEAEGNAKEPSTINIFVPNSRLLSLLNGESYVKKSSHRYRPYGRNGRFGNYDPKTRKYTNDRPRDAGQDEFAFAQSNQGGRRDYNGPYTLDADPLETVSPVIPLANGGAPAIPVATESLSAVISGEDMADKIDKEFETDWDPPQSPFWNKRFREYSGKSRESSLELLKDRDSIIRMNDSEFKEFQKDLRRERKAVKRQENLEKRNGMANQRQDFGGDMYFARLNARDREMEQNRRKEIEYEKSSEYRPSNSIFFFSTHDWRILYIPATRDTFAVAVAQKLKTRQEIVFNALSSQRIPLTFGLSILILLLLISVRYSLKPLKKLAGEVENRSPNDSTPINTDVPREVQPVVSALNRLFLRVEDTIQREHNFTQDAAHELRSPLAALRIQTEALKLADKEEDKDHILQQIDTSLTRASHLIEQLLILAKIDPLEGKVFDKDINWMDVSNDTLQLVNLHAREKRIRLSRKILCPEDEILPIKGDGTLISLLIRNLLDNAIRYSGEMTEVTLVMDRDWIKVMDNGPGISEEDLKKVRGRFYRPPGQKQTGSGLGLSIVDQIADLHNLAIQLANRETGGLEVTIVKNPEAEKRKNRFKRKAKAKANEQPKPQQTTASGYGPNECAKAESSCSPEDCEKMDAVKSGLKKSATFAWNDVAKPIWGGAKKLAAWTKRTVGGLFAKYSDNDQNKG